MDRLQLRLDVYDMIDTHPMQDVDIAPLIEKYSEGLDIMQQRSVRVTIRSTLTDMKKDGEIEFNDSVIGNITTTMASVFVGSGGFIRSTWKYVKEKEKQADKKENSIQVGTNYGIVSQDSETSLRDFQPTMNPPITPTTDAAKEGIITSIGKWILKNIIVVIITSLIVAFIVYKLRWNN
jgi:hypothetical protein